LVIASRARFGRTARFAVVVLVAGLASSGCRKQGSACKRASDHAVVACYANDTLSPAELEPFLPAAVRRSTSSLSDPRAEALDEAIAVRLLADEASRRALPAVGDSAEHRRASAYQALRRDVVAERRLSAGDVTDEDARRYYEAHPGRFNKITQTYCRGIFVADEALARQLHARLQGADEEAFAAAARASSTHASAADGGALGETHAGSIDPFVRTLSNDLRDVGQLLGPARLESGGFVLLYATQLTMATKPYEEVAAQVRNHIARDRQEAALDQLAATLRPQARVEVFADELALVPLPKPAPPAQ
jgi:peptidyl-prolyl cis-trans isomerase D